MSLLLALALSAAAPAQVAAFGAGARSCEAAFAPERYETTFAWVMGYFSGVNSGTNGTVGRTANGEGIIAEVEGVCLRDQAASLIHAAETAYIQMREAHR